MTEFVLNITGFAPNTSKYKYDVYDYDYDESMWMALTTVLSVSCIEWHYSLITIYTFYDGNRYNTAQYREEA